MKEVEMLCNLSRKAQCSLAGAVFAATIAAPLAAGADTIVSIPINGVSYGEPGSSILVGSRVMPDDYVGKTCSVIGTSGNGSSIHPGNDLVIMSGGESIVISDFEDTGNAIHQVQSVSTLGSSMEVYLRFGEDGISSGGITVSVADCFDPTPTTVETTTTVAPTSTTVEPTTTTVAPTTVAPTTAAPTTVAPTTVVPTTVVAPTSTPPTTNVVSPTTIRRATTVVPTTEVTTTEEPTTTEAVVTPSTTQNPITPQGEGSPLEALGSTSTTLVEVDPLGPTVTTGALAFTGGNAIRLLIGGLMLVAGGTAFWFFGLGRRDEDEATAS